MSRYFIACFVINTIIAAIVRTVSTICTITASYNKQTKCLFQINSNNFFRKIFLFFIFKYFNIYNKTEKKVVLVPLSHFCVGIHPGLQPPEQCPVTWLQSFKCRHSPHSIEQLLPYFPSLHATKCI